MTQQVKTDLAADATAPTLDLFRNRHVLTGAFPNAFASHYSAGKTADGLNILELRDDDAALVMTKSGAHREWTKSEFQALAKPEATPELKAKARADFNATSDEDLMKMRTVGCGTSVLCRFSDGDFYVAVERTAAKTTPDGVVNPGAYSRAAGGSTGDINQSALRELSEELFMVIRMGDHKRLINIVPDGYNDRRSVTNDILRDRDRRARSVIEAHGENYNTFKEDITIPAPLLAVPGLTESVVERANGRDKVLKNRVFSDSPHQMDVNGVDGVTVLHLPFISSKDVVGIYDGETNTKGELLKRRWVMFGFDELHDKLARKELNMSPAPAKVVQAKDAVSKAIDAELRM